VSGLALAAALRGTRTADAAPLPEEARTAEFAEYLGSLLAMISLLIFGAVLLGPALEHLSWRIVGYAVLSLTVVRMIPVVLALAGTGLKPPTVAYVAWFGPRGLASIVLGLLVAEEPVTGAELIGRVIAVTVGLSILLHGASAVFLSDRYAAWYQRVAATTPDLRESAAPTATLRRRAIGAPHRRA
jgi:NhaP-type Na+/H+ or K+/H+ antiporter